MAPREPFRCLIDSDIFCVSARIAAKNGFAIRSCTRVRLAAVANFETLVCVRRRLSGLSLKNAVRSEGAGTTRFSRALRSYNLDDLKKKKQKKQPIMK